VRSAARACALQSTWDDTGQLHVLGSHERRTHDRAYALLIDTGRAKRRLGDRLGQRSERRSYLSLAIPSSITLGRVSMRAEEKQQRRDTETRAGSCTWVRAYACTKASRAIRLERRALGLFGASAPIPWRRGDYTGCAPRVRAITMGCQIGPFRRNSPPTRRLRPRSAISFGSLPDRFPSSSSERASERASGIGRNRSIDRSSERASERTNERAKERTSLSSTLQRR